MRVLHLVSTFARKTDTKWLLQLLGRLSPERFASVIGCMYGGGEMQPEFERVGIPTFNLAAPKAFAPGALWRLVGHIRKLQPEIVHTHLLRADLYGGAAARLAGVRTVLTTQYAIHPYARATHRWCDHLLDRMCRVIATDALAVSEAVRQDLLRRVGWAEARTHTVRTGLDFESWHADPGARSRLRRQWSIPQGCQLVMTVARLSWEKGLDVLVRAAGLVSRKHPSVRFVIVGDGPLSPQLVNQIRACGLENHVCLAGFHEDIPSVLSAADLFVMPSYMEGMPNALLEAFAAGLPVVASAVGGIPEAIESERTGLLVPPGDPDALAEAVLRLLAAPDLSRTLAEHGSQVARARFGIDKVAREYELLYEAILQVRVPQGVNSSPHPVRPPADNWEAGGRTAIP